MKDEAKVIDDLELLRQLKSLPKELQPPHDLWEDIEDKLHMHPRRFNRWLMGSMAASVLLSFGLTVFLVQSQQQVAYLEQQVADEQLYQLYEIEHQFNLAKTGMLSKLANSEAFQSESSKQALSKELALIEKAINEIKKAIKAEPNNPYLAEMLVHTYQQQLAMLEKLSNSHGVVTDLI